jgi:ESS family glutamate:Na+ symporter
MMNTIVVSEFVTLIAGLISLVLGDFACKKVRLLQTLSIPPPVIGGLFTAIAALILESAYNLNFEFAIQLRDVLILLFFVSLGFSARLADLRTGGKPLLFICLATVLLLFIQNIIGISVAMFRGAHPFYGLLAGSVSFVGGPATALAWAKEATVFGLEGAELVAISAATFAVAIGALVSAPIVTWIINKHKLKNESTSIDDSAATIKMETHLQAANSQSIIKMLLLVSVAVFLGNQLNKFATSRDILLPGFLCSILAGMLFTNVAEAGKWTIPTKLIDKLGDISLQIFLVISMMSLKLSSLGAILVPLAMVVVLQVLFSAIVAYLIVFHALGKNYNAAVTVGGFLGFAISSMPIAMATMEQVTKRYGPAPQAILIITLAGSFFVDLANAVIVKLFMSLLPYIS